MLPNIETYSSSVGTVVFAAIPIANWTWLERSPSVERNARRANVGLEHLSSLDDLDRAHRDLP
jgi:hypothetical protein